MKTRNTSRATRASRLPRTVRLAVFSLLAFALAATSFATTPGNAAENPDKMVELKLELPANEIVSGRCSSNIENLDTRLQYQQAPLRIPKNANQNIAFKKPVTSGTEETGELNFITDGDKDASSAVELEPGLQWVQIDLQKRSEIFAIALWHFHNRLRAYRNVIVQISDDVEFKSGVTTVFNTDFKNTAKLGAGKDKHYVETNYGKLIPVSEVKGRYVRLYSQGNTDNPGNHYIEVEVYGRVAIPENPNEMVVLRLELPPVELSSGGPNSFRIENLDWNPQKPILIPKNANQNIAFKKPVTSGAKVELGELSYVTDGDKDGAEGFEVELEPGLQWVQIDLQKRSEIFAIALWHFHRKHRAYRNVIVQISDDAEFKSGVTTVFNTDFKNTAKLGAGKDKHYIDREAGKLISVSGVKGRYVRLYSQGNTTNPGNHYIEVEVYGRDIATPNAVKP